MARHTPPVTSEPASKRPCLAGDRHPSDPDFVEVLVLGMLEGVGLRHYRAAAKQVDEGDTVVLRREPNNPHDPNAIRLLNAMRNMEHFGYLSVSFVVTLLLMLLLLGLLHGVVCKLLPSFISVFLFCFHFAFFFFFFFFVFALVSSPPSLLPLPFFVLLL